MYEAGCLTIAMRMRVVDHRQPFVRSNVDQQRKMGKLQHREQEENIRERHLGGGLLSCRLNCRRNNDCNRCYSSSCEKKRDEHFFHSQWRAAFGVISSFSSSVYTFCLLTRIRQCLTCRKTIVKSIVSIETIAVNRQF